MPNQNPFGGLAVEDEDPEDESLVAVASTEKNVDASAPPVQKGGRKPVKSIPGDKPKADTREATDGGYEGDTRGRGRGRGGRGRGGRNNKDHRSKRGQTKPDEKRHGHGAGNWGSTEEAITDAVEKIDVKAEGPTADTPVEEEAEEEEVQITYEEHLKLKAEARSKLPATSIRQAGEDDGAAGYKVGGEKVEREEFTPITFSGKEAKAKKQKDRGGRALTKLEVDFKFSNENSQMETRGSDRGARGEGRGGRRGGRGGRGRGEGRGEGRGRGRGRGEGSRAPANQFTEADFPSLT